MSDLAKIIRDTAERVRAGGVPDCLNRWLEMTPDSLAALETRLERVRRPNRGDYEMGTTMVNGAAPGASLSTMAATLEAKQEVKETPAAPAASTQGPAPAAAPRPRSTPAEGIECTTRTLLAGVPPRSRRKNAADDGDAALIRQATSFLTKIQRDGEWVEKTSTTLAEARERGLAMEAGHTRRSVVYAVLADGRAVLVPRSYTAPATPEQESNMKTNAKTENQKPAKPASKPAERAKPKDDARKAVKGPTTKGGKTKAEIIQDMLTAKNGATRKALSEATGYPTVNLKMALERAQKTIEGKVKMVCLDEEAGRFKFEVTPK